jgi:hypothetical protein
MKGQSHLLVLDQLPRVFYLFIHISLMHLEKKNGWCINTQPVHLITP